MNGLFSATKRKTVLQGLHQAHTDVLIIGGGITGAGIALDSVTRGLDTVLLEMQDFAAGTSSRSTKLVHGGLRYLKQFEVKMVAEVGKERAIVYENGPHVTEPEWMMLPFHKGGTFGRFSTSLGLRVYDYLAGVKRSERRQMLGVEETIRREPLVKREGLKGSGYYVEYRTDDARLTVEVMKEAVSHGAKALNYVKVDKLLYDGNGNIKGVQAVDQLDGTPYEIYARYIINAAGPWVDSLREKDGSKTGKHLQLTKGVHLVIDQSKFPLKQAIYFDTPDGRMVFAIPRDGKTYVGTTDTLYRQDPAHPKMNEKDRTYILSAIRYMFPEVNIGPEDIESSWAGVRPLIYEDGKNASEISRKDEIWQSPSGLITIAGGKLTGYRKMAETVVDLIGRLHQEKAGTNLPACQTKNMPISGGHVNGSAGFPAFIRTKAAEGPRHGISKETAEQWVRMYGSNIDRLYGWADEARQQNETLPLEVLVPLRYSLEEESVVKPQDFFIRRTGALFFRIDWVRKWKEDVIRYMASYFGWDETLQQKYSSEMDQFLHDAVVPDPNVE